MIVMRISRFVCLAAVLASVFAYRVDGAAAQGSDAERQACKPDAMRLCGDAIPDIAKVTACMKAKYSQLSQPCRVAMAGSGKSKTRSHHARRHCHHCG
jgi:hypothetical protein